MVDRRPNLPATGHCGVLAAFCPGLPLTASQVGAAKRRRDAGGRMGGHSLL